MQISKPQLIATLLITCSISATSLALAGELTAQVQKDLIALGYDPGTISGDMTPETTIAIAKFEQDRGMNVSGSVSPEIASTLAAAVDQQRNGGAVTASSAPATPAATSASQDPEALRAAQQACLQEKLAAAQGAQKKKRGLGRLFGAVARTATRFGNTGFQQVAWDVYDANATYEDLAGAARDLGLAESEIAACQNPG